MAVNTPGDNLQGPLQAAFAEAQSKQPLTKLNKSGREYKLDPNTGKKFMSEVTRAKLSESIKKSHARKKKQAAYRKRMATIEAKRSETKQAEVQAFAEVTKHKLPGPVTQVKFKPEVKKTRQVQHIATVKEVSNDRSKLSPFPWTNMVSPLGMEAIALRIPRHTRSKLNFVRLHTGIKFQELIVTAIEKLLDEELPAYGWNKPAREI